MELQDQQQVVGLRVVEVVMVIHLFKHLPLQPEAEEQAGVLKRQQEREAEVEREKRCRPLDGTRLAETSPEEPIYEP